MESPRKLDGKPATEVHALAGIEVDNLLAILALLGLLRALEEETPEWRPRASWAGPPWLAKLHLAAPATQDEIAGAASNGVTHIASRFDFGSRQNVDFESPEFREFAEHCRSDPTRAALATALTAEHPEKQGGGLRAAPLIMMFGQGHQNFLERLTAVPLGHLPNRLAKSKSPPDLRHPRFVAKALFEPWTREDDSDGFRWDPEEDQRYAFRFGDPSKAGAASTVHGANRLAAVGFLSFPFAPANREPNVPAIMRGEEGIVFLWPVWTEPLSLHGIRRLMCHPELAGPSPRALAPLGVAQVYAARRIANGKFMNVTRAVPMSR